jgi:hypothetical protein
MHATGSKYNPTAEVCEESNGHMGPIHVRGFLDQLGNKTFENDLIARC